MVYVLSKHMFDGDRDTHLILGVFANTNELGRVLGIHAEEAGERMDTHHTTFTISVERLRGGRS